MRGEVAAVTELSAKEYARLTLEDFASRYVAPNRPFVVRKAHSRPDGEEVDFAYLERMCGDHEVPVRFFPGGENDGVNFVHKKMTIGNYLRLIADSDEAAKQYYLSLLPAKNTVPEILPGLQVPKECVAEKATPVVFIGRSTYSQLHYHPGQEAIATMVYGRKRFVLYSPSDTVNLYPAPWYGPGHNFSSIDHRAIEANSCEKYPLFARARLVEVVLEAGDFLYIPTYWWHVVYGDDPCVLVTYFWESKARAWKFPQGPRMYGLRLLRSRAVTSALRCVLALKQRITRK
jgi:hypothetical protein